MSVANWPVAIISECARFTVHAYGCNFPVKQDKSSAPFHFFPLRMYVYFVTFVCIEAVWVETVHDGGNKDVPSLDNLVLLLEKGLKVAEVSYAVRNLNCLYTNTKGTCTVFYH